MLPWIEMNGWINTDWISIGTSLINRADSQKPAPRVPHSSPYIRKSGQENKSANSTSPTSGLRVSMEKASWSDHTLHIHSLWTYCFSILQAPLHMSLPSTFDFYPGQLLCRASTEQNLIHWRKDRPLALISPQVFQQLHIWYYTQREIKTLLVSFLIVYWWFL